MTAPDTQRRLTILETKNQAVLEDLDEIKGDLRALRDVLVSGKGAARVLAALFGAGVAMGGAILAWLSWFGVRPG